MMKRGLPQGTTWGPQLFSVTLQFVLQPAYLECQQQEMGANLDGHIIPFVVFSDNITALSMDFEMGMAILDIIRRRLAEAGWSLPQDRTQVLYNREAAEAVATKDVVFPEVVTVLAQAPHKLLGITFDANGSAAKDVANKSYGLESFMTRHKCLLECHDTSRKSRFELIHRIAQSHVPWSAGVWNLNQRQLSGLRALQNNLFRKALRLPRMWQEDDERYSRRCNAMVRQLKMENKWWDLDALVLKRQYTFIGHACRFAIENPTSLLGATLSYRNEHCRNNNRDNFGRMGFPGKVAPWNQEFQFQKYFRERGLVWQDVAADRRLWRRHMFPWIKDRLGETKKNVIMS